MNIHSKLYSFPDGSVVKNLPANARDMDLIPGSGRSPGEGNVPYPGLDIEIPRTEEPGSPWGHVRVGHDLVTKQ